MWLSQVQYSWSTDYPLRGWLELCLNPNSSFNFNLSPRPYWLIEKLFQDKEGWIRDVEKSAPTALWAAHWHMAHFGYPEIESRLVDLSRSPHLSLPLTSGHIYTVLSKKKRQQMFENPGRIHAFECIDSWWVGGRETAKMRQQIVPTDVLV